MMKSAKAFGNLFHTLTESDNPTADVTGHLLTLAVHFYHYCAVI